MKKKQTLELHIVKIWDNEENWTTSIGSTSNAIR